MNAKGKLLAGDQPYDGRLSVELSYETPDDWDPDCFPCFPGDPFCEQVRQVSGNDSCATAYDMTEQATFESWIEADDAGEVSPTCGGAGGDVFFAFTLESEQADVR